MANPANSNAAFQLRSIELHQLIVNRPAAGVPMPVNFNFDVQIQANVDAAQKVIINSATINVRGDNEQNSLGSITCVCVFSVANFEEVVYTISETQSEIDDVFADTINSITISTARGMMASELRGTYLHFAFLPIIDVKGLKKNVPESLLGTIV
jgi:hypothetical protein